MSSESRQLQPSTGQLPTSSEAISANGRQRQLQGKLWESFLLINTLAAIIVLLLLAANIANDAFGGVAVQEAVDSATLTAGRTFEELSNEELIVILEENLRSRVLRNLEREQPLAEREQADLIAIINAEIVKPEIVSTFSLWQWLFERETISVQVAEKYPRAELQFKSWLNWNFIVSPMSSDPTKAGVRTAILGSFYLLLLVMVIAFPLGIAAAIFLEEYQRDKPFDERSAAGRLGNRIFERISSIIQVNIYNLSGVPSIIYGMLGLAIFVRTFEPFTSGAIFGSSSGGSETLNGRTVFSAALTMALLVLPVVIIASQEAIRAVPSSLRQASYGLGSTRLQTIRHIVLPNALPGILTGTILAISRAIGETAPLIVVGASTFIVSDPNGIFSKFTVLPIQIYNWTSRPEPEFRAIAAAAIIVLLIMLLSINAAAILLRNYVRARRVV